ncbi:MAG TPA: ABC transporter permease [Candidatus Dormibacteraeota bacterium]
MVTSGRGWRGYALLGPAMAAMLLFFAAAMVVLLLLAFQRVEEGQVMSGLTGANLVRFASNRYYWGVIGTSMKLGAVTVVISALVGYPVALAIDRIRGTTVRGLALFLLFSPLLTSVIVRSYGWELMLGDHGVINTILLDLHILARPLRILFEFSGVTVAMVHILLPFMVLPILGVLSQMNPSLVEAAQDLGASRLQVFLRILLPLTIQGVVVGCQLVFALSISAFATPTLLGGGRVQVLAGLIYNDVGQLDWPLAAVESYALLVLALATVLVFNRLLRLTARPA